MAFDLILGDEANFDFPNGGRAKLLGKIMRKPIYIYAYPVFPKTISNFLEIELAFSY